MLVLTCLPLVAANLIQSNPLIQSPKALIPLIGLTKSALIAKIGKPDEVGTHEVTFRSSTPGSNQFTFDKQRADRLSYRMKSSQYPAVFLFRGEEMLCVTVSFGTKFVVTGANYQATLKQNEALRAADYLKLGYGPADVTQTDALGAIIQKRLSKGWYGIFVGNRSSKPNLRVIQFVKAENMTVATIYPES